MLYLHIGLPKAGSTFLQKWCALNADWLAQKGCDFPDGAFLQDGAHNPMVAPLFDSEDATGTPELWAHLLARYDDRDSGSNMLISSELFAVATTMVGEMFERRIMEVMEGRDFKLVIAVRRHADLLQSMYNQLLKKAHYLGSISDLYHVAGEEILGYRPLVDRLAGALGRERIAVLPLGQVGSDPYTLVDQMLALMGVDARDYQRFGPDDAINQSLPLPKLRRRWRRTMDGQRPLQPFAEWQAQIQPHTIAPEAVLSDAFFRLTPSLRAEIESRYQDDAAHMLATYIAPDQHALFARDPSRDQADFVDTNPGGLTSAVSA